MGLTKPRAHQLQDIDYKQTARAVTTSNITLSGGAPATVDGVSLALRDRVLVTGQSTGSENGIYYVTTVGAGSNGTWARSLDADTTGEVSAGMIIMITEGTTYADTQWKLTTDDPITIGTTALTFVRNGNAAYGTVAVSGEDSIVADAIGDTLTIVAGTNLALTTNASTDTLTITPSLTPSFTSITAAGLSYPTSDGTADQVLVTNGSGTLSFADASGGGATVSSDTTTNTNFLLYFASTTTGDLTAVKQDSGLTYNPSTGLLTSAAFSGSGASLTALNGSNITTGTVAAARVATLNQNTTGSAATLTTARAIALSGDVVGTADFDGSAGISIATIIQANSVALGTDTTGNYVGAGATSGNGISGSVSSEGGTFTVTSNATNANTGSTIVFRDGSGNFSAGVITATATTARYADLAERYTADADYEPGTVVELGGEYEVTQTRRSRSTAIAGVVSTDPAYLMNNDLEGISVALIGRVPCKVVGKVRKGDLLISSDSPGHAQAYKDMHNPPTGSVIGKAIESKDNEETGVIEVLVGRL